MNSLAKTLFALLATLSLVACSQTICPDGSAGNCEAKAGVDGGAGGGETCDDPSLTSCDGVCVDTDVNPTYCGACGNTCDQGQGCSAGECVDLCDPGQVNCGGTCIDPQTDGDFCGASGTCSGANAGVDCGDGELCSAGACVTAKRYLGSLTSTTGRFTYGGTIGLDGATAQCQALYAPDAVVCSYGQLLDAQQKGDLVGATDNLGNPVDSFFVIDLAAAGVARQCTKTDAENVPWSYETEHLGQGSKFVTVNATAGTISAVQELGPSIVNSCGATRFVACCNP